MLLVEHKSRGKDLDRATSQALDRAVDAAYGCTIFKSEAERVAFLFERYQQLSAPLGVLSEKAVKNRGRKIKP